MIRDCSSLPAVRVHAFKLHIPLFTRVIGARSLGDTKVPNERWCLSQIISGQDVAGTSAAGADAELGEHLGPCS
jgi:hypothetical protein